MQDEAIVSIEEKDSGAPESKTNMKKSQSHALDGFMGDSIKGSTPV